MSALGHTTPRWGLRQPRQKAVSCWHHGSLVEVGYRCASVSFDPCATPFFLEVIPHAPLVAARTPPIALTGVFSGLALRDLFAVPGDVFVGQARWIETQPLGQLSAEPFAFFPTQICHGHSSCTICNLRVRYRIPALARDRNGALRFRTRDVKGLGTQVAAKMLPDGTKALAPSDAAVVGQEFQADPVALGQVAIGLLDVLPVMRHATAEYAYLRQSVRTNNAAVVAVRYLAPRAADLL